MFTDKIIYFLDVALAALNADHVKDFLFFFCEKKNANLSASIVWSSGTINANCLQYMLIQMIDPNCSSLIWWNIVWNITKIEMWKTRACKKNNTSPMSFMLKNPLAHLTKDMCPVGQICRSISYIVINFISK